MFRTRHSAEQIVNMFHDAATAMAGWRKVEEMCKALGISPATYHRWQKQYLAADVEAVREFKALKEENARLRRLVADLSLDKQALKELAEG